MKRMLPERCSGPVFPVFLLLVAAVTPAFAGQIRVQYIDNDGPQWIGRVDTQTDQLIITSWVNGNPNSTLMIPSLPAIWPAMGTVADVPGDSWIRPYDVPDQWDRTFTGSNGLPFAFMSQWTNAAGEFYTGFGGTVMYGVVGSHVVSGMKLAYVPVAYTPLPGDPYVYMTRTSIPDMVWIEGQYNVGDIDGDGRLSWPDIDQLSLGIRLGSPCLAYDVDLDGTVTPLDHGYWVSVLLGTTLGDSNLDRQFNASDIILAFQWGKYENGLSAGWQQGDWNGSGQFDSGDLVSAFQCGSYEASPAAMVPEPSAIVLLLIGLAVLLRR